VGLPEVKLGILPGGGGTQRLPRLVGAQKALEMIIFGEPIGALEALEVGIVDELIGGDLRDGAIAFARKVLAERRPQRRVRDREDRLAAGRANPGLFGDFVARHPEAFRGAWAPNNCLRSIRAAFELPFEQGLAREWELTKELMPGLQAKAMRHIFFAEREAWKIPGLDRAAPVPAVEVVGVLGAGAEADEAARIFRAAGLGVATDRDPKRLSDCDLVVTAGDDLQPAERGLGVRFHPQVGPRRFVEVKWTAATALPAAAQAMQLLKRLGMVAILTRTDPPGVGARMRRTLRSAVEAAVNDGAAPAQVEAALYGFGFPAGASGCNDIAASSTDPALLARLLRPVVEDGARILHEGLAVRASDLDLMWVTAFGWPAYRGGPMFYGENPDVAAA
jgi:hypothetical protein